MKQAYIICAHGSFRLLEKLVTQLDCPSNDIFIHIDKKVGNVDYSRFELLAKYSYVYCLRNRISINWGGYSQVEGTLLLLDAALSHGEYDYIHFISGVDFPIKSNEYIESFLKEHNGFEFVGYSGWHPTLDYKLGFYHIVPQNLQTKFKFFYFFSKLLIKFQKIIGVKRVKDTSAFAKGCNWWTITGRLAQDVVRNKKQFRDMYHNTLCCDEIFLQTFIKEKNGEYKVYRTDNEYLGCLRCIDWKRGNPYIWGKNDLDELLASSALFARKFSEDAIDFIDVLRKKIK